MYTWRYQAGEAAPSFILAGDARLVTTDYLNDQVWELVPGRSEPPAVTVQTSYGLRARGMRIFLRFGESGNPVSDPAQFPGALHLRQVGPAWIQAEFSPLAGLDVVADYFIQHPNAFSGRITLKNPGEQARSVRFELAAVLNPSDGGNRLHPAEIRAVQVLCGASANLAPLLFITGGAKASVSAYPCLEQTLTLEPGESRAFNWTCAACASTKESFDLARRLAAAPPEEFLARVEMLEKGLLQIRTGNRAWNQAFDRALITAYALLHSANAHLPQPSFVTTRHPDQGFSLRGDGSDYGPLWNGQAALPALYLSQFLLPANPEIVQGILENFLAATSQNGPDWKPGLGGQRSHFSATPVLASLAWEVYRQTSDREWLGRIFEPLRQAFLAWFTPAQDRDEDGLPEWSNSLQTGLEDHPAYAHWLKGTPALDITSVESPDLLAFLYREGDILRRMAMVINHKESLKPIQRHLNRLAKATLQCWDERQAVFHPQDRDTHVTQAAELLGTRRGPGLLRIRRKFRQPVRLRIAILTPEGQNRRAEGSIRGRTAGFPAEQATGAAITEEALPPDRFRWRPTAGQVTSQAVFSSLEQVRIENIEAGDEVRVETVGHILEDISGLGALWAGLPSQKQAHEMYTRALKDKARFGKPYGIPASGSPDDEEAPEDALQSVHLPWNLLVIQGLLSYNMRSEATELVSHLMEACTRSLEREGAFRRFYHAVTGSGSGERDGLEGLPPVGLFLKVLGVQILSPTRVQITDQNPFPWPVTVRYRGLTVLRQKEKTTVIFPDGQITSVSDPGSYEISL
jgi:hypothetical protein